MWLAIELGYSCILGPHSQERRRKKCKKMQKIWSREDSNSWLLPLSYNPRIAKEARYRCVTAPFLKREVLILLHTTVKESRQDSRVSRDYQNNFICLIHSLEKKSSFVECSYSFRLVGAFSEEIWRKQLIQPACLKFMHEASLAWLHSHLLFNPSHKTPKEILLHHGKFQVLHYSTFSPKRKLTSSQVRIRKSLRATGHLAPKHLDRSPHRWTRLP